MDTRSKSSFEIKYLSLFGPTRSDPIFSHLFFLLKTPSCCCYCCSVLDSSFSLSPSFQRIKLLIFQPKNAAIEVVLFIGSCGSCRNQIRHVERETKRHDTTRNDHTLLDAAISKARYLESGNLATAVK